MKNATFGMVSATTYAIYIGGPGVTMFGFSYSSSKLKVQKPTRIVIEKSSCVYCIFNGDESLTTFDRVSFTPLVENRINTKRPHPLKNLHLKIKINILGSWRFS